jgi:hypothetical protein
LKPCNPYVGEMSLTTRTQEYMPPKKHPKTLLWISLPFFIPSTTMGNVLEILEL